MLYWVILFILGEVVCRITSISMVMILAVGMAAGIFVIPISFLKKQRTLLWIGSVFLLLGAVRVEQVQTQEFLSKMEEGADVAFSGKVVDLEQKEKGNVYLVKAVSLNEKKWSGKIRFTLAEEEELEWGSYVCAKGEVKNFSKATNPGGYDEESVRKGNGIFLQLQNVLIVENTPAKYPLRGKLMKIRQHLVVSYQKLFGEKNASLAAAMVLGEKKTLDADVKSLYQRNGIAHLIAISGLHIAMIGGTLYQLLRKCSGSYTVSAVIGLTFILLYGIMTGLSGATLRAVIMLGIQIGAEVGGRRYDSITAVALALLLMLFHNPFQITQVGFLLSFGAILGIIWIQPAWKMLFPKLPNCMDGLLVSISVQIMTLPIMLYYFYEIPVYGIFLNVIVVPVMSILLFCLIVCGITGCFFTPAAQILAKPAQWIFWLYEWLCTLTEKLPLHTVCIGRPELVWIVFYYLLLAVTLWIISKRGFCRLLFLMGIMYAGLFVLVQGADTFKICMLDVGQGDGIYMRTPEGKHILMDGGSSSKQKVGEYVLKNGVKYYGGAVLDYVFISHTDSDHYSGILELLEEETIQIKHLVLPVVSQLEDADLELEQKAAERGCVVYRMKAGDQLKIGELTFNCLHPDEKGYTDKNQGSLVLLASYGEFDFLMTGDIDNEIVKGLIDKISDSIEVLKVAHHGSATASSEEFLMKLNPSVALVSVGENNRYGHPAKECMERLEQFCDKIYLTKDSGAITIETDGSTYQIETYVTTQD